MQLYTADGDKKLIFPVVYEDIDFDAVEGGLGMKFVISSVNWTMCRPGMDDYNNSISKLIQGMKKEGTTIVSLHVHVCRIYIKLLVFLSVYFVFYNS